MSGRRFPDMWLDPEDDPREVLTSPSGERQTLLNYLDHYRLTFEMKCDGLDAEQMARRGIPPSTMSLLGLVRHLAQVEHYWFRSVMERQQLTRLFWSEEDRDLDFNGAVGDPAVVTEAWAAWRDEVAHARTVVGGIDSLDYEGTRSGERIPMRDVIVHLIEEYARHCGHADLLREVIDGRTGQ